jgi:hypothetical protein
MNGLPLLHIKSIAAVQELCQLFHQNPMLRMCCTAFESLIKRVSSPTILDTQSRMLGSWKRPVMLARLHSILHILKKAHQKKIFLLAGYVAVLGTRLTHSVAFERSVKRSSLPGDIVFPFPPLRQVPLLPNSSGSPFTHSVRFPSHSLQGRRPSQQRCGQAAGQALMGGSTCRRHMQLQLL